MRFHLGYILGLFAVLLATGAGYISVVGWGKLFAGEATIVMIVMGIIEAAKVVTTIYLHRYGKKEPRPEGVNRFSWFFKRIVSLKTYLVIGVMSTMFLTSVGIYGFLTGAYQETANKMEIHGGEVGILEGKRDIFKQKIVDNNEIKDDKGIMIDKLIVQRENLQKQLDELLENEHWSNAKKTRAAIETTNDEIAKLTQDIDDINTNNSTLQDSVSTYQVQILELESTSDIAAEIGPLKYISSLTGRPMDSIINWIVLIIIFIFDPMAISLVLASNKVFDKNKKDREGGEPEDTPEPLPDPDPVTPDLDNHFEDVTSYERPADKGVDSETGEIDLPEETLPMVEDIWLGNDGEPVDSIDIIEPEPSGTTNEVINEEDIIDEDIEEVIPEEEVVEDTKVEETTDVDTGFPEKQIEENKEKIQEAIKGIEQIKNSKPKQTPVIPTGNVKREEIKEIKQGTRGYSVNVPEPKKVGTNKEVREDEPRTFYFKRPNPSQL